VGVSLSGQLATIGDSVIVRGGAVDSNRTERGISGIGDGALSHRFVALDTAAGLIVPGLSVTVRNAPQTTVLARGWTDGDGILAVNLDPDTVVVTAAGPGYQFEPYDTVIVDDSGIDTLFGASRLPEEPDLAGLCRVWGYLYDVGGAPEYGAVVRAGLYGEVGRYGGAIISPASAVTTTDSTGYFQLDLIPSDLLASPGALYDFSISRTDGAILHQRLLIPNQALWQLTW